MYIERMIGGLAVVGTIVLGASSASAAVMTYDLAWQSQTVEGNTASAVLTMDDAVFDPDVLLAERPESVARCELSDGGALVEHLCVDVGGIFPGMGITGFDLTVLLDGESISFDPTLFSPFMFFDTRIDPTEEMVGQAGFRDFNFFSEQFPTEEGIDFELIGLSAMIAPVLSPPNGVAENTFAFAGENFVLTSFALADDMASVPVPASALMLLTAIGGLGAARARRKT